MAADWHELMIPWRGMQSSTARDSGQVDPRRSTTDIPPPQSATLGLHPVARRLLLINRPRRDGTLSRRWYTAATGGSRPRDRKVQPRTTRPPRTIENLFRTFYNFLCPEKQRHGQTDRWTGATLNVAYTKDCIIREYKLLC